MGHECRRPSWAPAALSRTAHHLATTEVFCVPERFCSSRESVANPGIGLGDRFSWRSNDDTRPSGQQRSPFAGFSRALFRTRTRDPLLTMELLRQTMANGGNAFGSDRRFSPLTDLRLIATGCNQGLHKRLHLSLSDLATRPLRNPAPILPLNHCRPGRAAGFPASPRL